MKKILSFVFFFSIFHYCIEAQNNSWNGKKCAIALTYDDGLDVHLDKVIPVLDSLGFRATFYIPGNSESLAKRLPEWRAIAKKGHELGNHTLFHPCVGKKPGREWVNPDYDLGNYSINRIIDEIKLENTLLKAIDGKDKRTFAYTCGDKSIKDSSFVPLIKSYFVGARTTDFKMEKIEKVSLYDIGTVFVYNHSGEQLIELVKKAQETGTLLVFLFHSVGGEYSINIPLKEHNKLLDFIKKNEKEIWVAPLVEIAEYIKEHR